MPTHEHFNVPYIVGGALGRDHQNWPTLSRSQLETVLVQLANPGISITNWGTTLTVQQMMALKWRVKTWQLKGTWDVTITGTDLGFTFTASTQNAVVEDDGSLAFNLRSLSPTLIPDERALLADGLSPFEKRVPPFYESDLTIPIGRGRHGGVHGRSTPNFDHEHVIQDDNSPDVPMNHFEGDTEGGGLIFISNNSRGEDVILYEDGMLSPFISFRLGAFFGHLLANASTLPPGSTETPNGSLTIDTVVAGSFTVPLLAVGGYRNQRQSGPPIPINSSGAAEVTLTAHEFYQYRNSLDQPVYDSTTGEQSNDPFA